MQCWFLRFAASRPSRCVTYISGCVPSSIKDVNLVVSQARDENIGLYLYVCHVIEDRGSPSVALSLSRALIEWYKILTLATLLCGDMVIKYRQDHVG